MARAQEGGSIFISFQIRKMSMRIMNQAELIFVSSQCSCKIEPFLFVTEEEPETAMMWPWGPDNARPGHGHSRGRPWSGRCPGSSLCRHDALNKGRRSGHTGWNGACDRAMDVHGTFLLGQCC